MNDKKLWVRLVNDKLEIGLGASDLTESKLQKAELEKSRLFDIRFTPKTYLEAQKLKSLYSVSKTLINKLIKHLADVEIGTSANRALARDKVLVLINGDNLPDYENKPKAEYLEAVDYLRIQHRKSFMVNGIEAKKNTKTGQERLFLNYGLNYYVTGQPTSSYSVWLKEEGYIATGKVYHSDYLDLDSTHAIKSFDEVATVAKTVTDEVATVAEQELALTEQELKQLVDAV